MSQQTNKPKNDLGLFAGVKPPQAKDRPKPDNTGTEHTQYAPGKSEKREPPATSTDNKHLTPANIGWLFYKDYYNGLDFSDDRPKDYFKAIFEEKNKTITSKSLSQYQQEMNALKLDFKNTRSFELTTEYPGLATGLGSPHESHHEGEYKLGFHFDYTTGLPIIPGSSVKGVLRSAFHNSPEYILYLLQNLPERNISLDISEIDVLEKEIFDGEAVSPYQRDIFLDAVIFSSTNNDSIFLADDFITPHPNEFKDPIPLQFLKVLPQVTFRFQFRLNDGRITAMDKMNLFKRILVDLGVGAKTNVGYGSLKMK